MGLVGTSKITRKFQATVPKAVRRQLGLAEGDLLVFVEYHKQIVVKKGTMRVKNE
jgi:AbrB family looped-hinge helix DNA binding protein